MAQALQLAKIGARADEVPVGAVVVYDGVVIADGYNRPIGDCDATAHAEMVAIRAACRYFGNYRLPKGCTLYVTLEPCTMCLGAMIHARISRLVFGTCEPKAGVVVSQETFQNKRYFNHHLQVDQGVLAEQCSAVLREFFANKRQQKRLIGLNKDALSQDTLNQNLLNQNHLNKDA